MMAEFIDSRADGPLPNIEQEQVTEATDVKALGQQSSESLGDYSLRMRILAKAAMVDAIGRLT